MKRSQIGHIKEQQWVAAPYRTERQESRAVAQMTGQGSKPEPRPTAPMQGEQDRTRDSDWVQPRIQTPRHVHVNVAGPRSSQKFSLQAGTGSMGTRAELETNTPVTWLGEELNIQS